MQLLCAGGIHPLETLVQPFGAVRLAGNPVKLLAQGVIRAVVAQAHLVADRLKIQARSADQQRHPAPRQNAVDRLAGHFPVHRNREHLVRIDHIDHVMRRCGQFFPCRLRRADVHPAIDLHGIHGDDFRVQRLTEADGRPRLARARGADERQYNRFHRNPPTESAVDAPEALFDLAPGEHDDQRPAMRAGRRRAA